MPDLHLLEETAETRDALMHKKAEYLLTKLSDGDKLHLVDLINYLETPDSSLPAAPPPVVIDDVAAFERELGVWEVEIQRLQGEVATRDAALVESERKKNGFFTQLQDAEAEVVRLTAQLAKLTKPSRRDEKLNGLPPLAEREATALALIKQGLHPSAVVKQSRLNPSQLNALREREGLNEIPTVTTREKVPVVKVPSVEVAPAEPQPIEEITPETEPEVEIPVMETKPSKNWQDVPCVMESVKPVPPLPSAPNVESLQKAVNAVPKFRVAKPLDADMLIRSIILITHKKALHQMRAELGLEIADIEKIRTNLKSIAHYYACLALTASKDKLVELLAVRLGGAK